MKRFLTIALAMALMLSMSGIAFASGFDSFDLGKFKAGASVKGNIIKNIFFFNDSEAYTGMANGTGNASMTGVEGTSEAESCGDDGCATNTSKKDVTNHGTADAYTNPADALNQSNNSAENTITDDAETAADCQVCVTGVAPVCECGTFLDENQDGHCDNCGCCPASIDGDIEENIEYDNIAYAATGDANATGNASVTLIAQDDKAKACNDGCATNTSEVTVCNTGDASAESGPATATNLANNFVSVDIFRGALSSKTIDICVDLLAN